MKISPSLMCANQLELIQNVNTLLKLGVDRLHLDVMDGNFVGNLALTFDIIKNIRPLTRLPFEVHLMVQHPSTYFDRLIEYGADAIIFHVETTEDIMKNIEYIKSRDVEAGLAIHLETPISTIKQYLPYIDYVLVMSVKTGYSGLKFDPAVLEKTHQLYSYIQQNNLKVKILSDGGIKMEHVEPLYKNGAEIFVAGTSMLFNHQGFSKNLAEFKKLAHANIQRNPILKEDEEVETTYRAAVLAEVNKFSVQPKKLRPLSKDEVVVKVMSCGVCGSDIERVYRKGMYAKNLVPGHEFSGVVTKVGKGNEMWLNKRVAVFPLIPCRECDYCKQKKYNLCEKYNYLGSRTDGGFSELVVVPTQNLIALPNNVSHDEAALIEPMAVVYHGLRKVPSLPNSVVVVLGLGPIGILAGMLAKKLGAHAVIGVDRNTHKREIALRCGFSETFSSENFSKTIRPNIVVEASGSSELVNQFVPLMQKESTMLLLANHAGDLKLSPTTMSTIMRSEIRIISSWNSNISDPNNNDWNACITYLSEKEIDLKPLITHSYGLSQITDAFDSIATKKIPSIKVMIKPNQ